MNASFSIDAAARLNDLVRQIEAGAALPLERAHSLPPEAYWSPALYDLELERIFRREWMCVARVDDLARSGDWLRFDLAGEPLLLTRDENGELHALSRVCRHRNIDLLAGNAERGGNQARIVCPYHLWSYRLDGRLAGAPEMQKAAGFERGECRLPEARIETWQGFVFVNLDPEAAPLSASMAGVDGILGGRDLTTWRTAGVVDWGEADANWKLAIENASECYHHIGTHRETLQPMWPGATVQIDHVDSPEWFYGTMTVSEAFSLGVDEGYPIHPTFFPLPAGLTPQQRSATLIIGVFPMFFIALSPDFCVWFRWYPTSPTTHELDMRILVPPEAMAAPDLEAHVAQVAESLRAIQGEDAVANAGIQRASRARAASPGRLSALEQPLWQFQRYLASRLGGG